MPVLFIAFKIAAPMCFAADKKGEVDVEKHTSPAHPHRKESFHYSQLSEREMTELAKLEEQARTVAKQEKVSDKAIEKALTSRRIILQTRADLVNEEFHITSKGCLVFHNHL